MQDKIIIILFILLLSIPVGNSFALNPQQDAQVCYDMGKKDAESGVSKRSISDPMLRQQAYYSFDSQGQQGNWPEYEKAFLTSCEIQYNSGYESVVPTAGTGADQISSTADCNTISEEDARQLCFVHQAKNNWRLCLQAPDVKNCVVLTAAERKDPSIILELTRPAGSNEITIYDLDDRDDMLKAYVPTTGDLSALKYMTDSRKHDGLLIYSMGSISIEAGRPPNENYCSQLRADYQKDPSNTNQSLEKEKVSNHNLCEAMAAALRDIAYDTNECNQILPNKVKTLTGWEVDDSVENCNNIKNMMITQAPQLKQALRGHDVDLDNVELELTQEEFDSLENGMVKEEDPYQRGFDDGKKNSECKDAGRNDFLEDRGKTNPGFFLIESKLTTSNPYLPLLEQDKYGKYRDGYTDGCNAAYSDGYDTERRKASSSGDGGCLIATAAYGTELSSEVQNLREIRNKMYETELGGNVMHAVNDFYYSFSPTVADWERQNPAFKETVKMLITPSITSFAMIDHSSIDSENGLVGYVVGIVSINMGMYFVIPAVLVWQIRKIM